MDDAETTVSGSEFQIVAAETGKSRLQIVDSLKVGTTRSLVAVDQSVRRPETLARSVSGCGCIAAQVSTAMMTRRRRDGIGRLCEQLSIIQ